MLERAREDGRWGVVHAFPGVTNGASNALSLRRVHPRRGTKRGLRRSGTPHQPLADRSEQGPRLRPLVWHSHRHEGAFGHDDAPGGSESPGHRAGWAVKPLRRALTGCR
jgi:hypothetical protein